MRWPQKQAPYGVAPTADHLTYHASMERRLVFISESNKYVVHKPPPNELGTRDLSFGAQSQVHKKIQTGAQASKALHLVRVTVVLQLWNRSQNHCRVTVSDPLSPQSPFQIGNQALEYASHSIMQTQVLPGMHSLNACLSLQPAITFANNHIMHTGKLSGPQHEVFAALPAAGQPLRLSTGRRSG